MANSERPLAKPEGHLCPSGFLFMSTILRQIGRRIRAAREKKGWFQRDLAEAADLPVRTVGRIERGEVDVRLSTLAKIARALRLSLKDLV